jgi:hypothetical protein
MHQPTEVSPAQMQDNMNLEVQYIVDSINKQNKIEIATPEYKIEYQL